MVTYKSHLESFLKSTGGGRQSAPGTWQLWGWASHPFSGCSVSQCWEAVTFTRSPGQQFPDQQLQHQLGTCWKCKFSNATPSLLHQNLGVGPSHRLSQALQVVLMHTGYPRKCHWEPWWLTNLLWQLRPLLRIQSRFFLEPAAYSKSPFGCLRNISNVTCPKPNTWFPLQKRVPPLSSTVLKPIFGVKIKTLLPPSAAHTFRRDQPPLG